MSRGVIYVAYGRRAIGSMRRSIETLKAHHSLPVVVVSDATELQVKGANVLRQTQSGQTNIQRSRQAKLNLFKYVPPKWKSILYLDADTEVRGSLTGGFKLLETGWDLVIAPSTAQDRELFHHVEDAERIYTIEALRFIRPLQLQAGVMFIRRSPAMIQFFKVWRKEWGRFKGQDQAALIRALDELPIRICLVGHDYNGGALVEHYFGRAR